MHAREENIVSVLDWLTANCWLLGPNGQNWMLVAGGFLLLYIGALTLAHFRQRRTHS
jgi:hypothetical protein